MSLKIAFTGDIMPGGVLHNKEIRSSQEMISYLKGFDLRIGTLECAIGDEPVFDPVKMALKQDVIYAPNINLNKLKALGIDCVSLANNHAFDLGEEGLRNTIQQLDLLGIAHCGAGLTVDEASKPAILQCRGKKIGIIGLCDNRDDTVGYVPVATESSSGMNSISNDYRTQVINLKRDVDYVFVMIHWGHEHTFWPDGYMLDIAYQCIDSGADGIIGGHQHRVQPLIHYHDKPIFLGLGNFLFPPRYLRAPRPMYYPDENEDTSKFPVTDVYPWVDQPTYKIWKRLGRIGAIGSIVLEDNKKIASNLKITQINEKHCLEFPNDVPFTTIEKITLKLIRSSIFNNGNYSMYSIMRFLYRGIRFGMRNMKKIYSYINKDRGI
ncbi:MAG: CapA family protein [Bacteroides sp.]|nr:CapA family protein [Bacteroides sp.]